MSTSLEELQFDQDNYVLNTYGPRTVFVKGEGSRLWDIEGHRYLDFGMGISVCNLGHCHPAVTRAIVSQAARLVHCSNLYMNANQPRLAAELVKRSFPGRVFFSNSGAEANEGQIKFARLWGSRNGGRHEIVVAEHSFHGRTLATLAATAKRRIREGFQPDMPGFVFARFNDLQSFADRINGRTAAVLVEPVQGEGGICPATPEFLQGLRRLCDERGILLLLDEVQCGMGRTGRFFAHQNYGIVPDCISMAKALANGVPMGGFIVRNPYSDLFTPGSHGSTFGGTPLACAAALAVLKAFDDEHVLENVNARAAELRGELSRLQRRHPLVKDFRGAGLMIGVGVGSAQKRVAEECRRRRLLVLTAGEQDIRLLPSLKVTSEEIAEAIAILDEALQAAEENPEP